MKKIPTATQIIRIMEEIAPKALALTGDPVGLQCGEPDKKVKCLMLALDATPETVSQASQYKADMLVTHHPLLYEPLTTGNLHGAASRSFARAIRENIAVYSSHTNLDASPEGINVTLAELLGLGRRTYLQGAGPEPFKVVVTVPPGHLEKVRSAAFEAGAGQIGKYSGCSFAVEGLGTFRPGEGAEPFAGKGGSDEQVKEARLELTVPPWVLSPVLSGIRGTHPYEEPAIDVYPTASRAPGGGYGIAGVLPRRTTVGKLASGLRQALNPGSMRLVGKKGASVKTVAVCAGSGASLLDAAIAAGAQLYITGDLKYHDARKAEDAGIHVLDVGHFAPEKYGFHLFGKLLAQKLSDRGLKVEIRYAKEKDPFLSVP